MNASSITSLAEYQALFRDAAEAKALGDVSPVYLYWPEAAGNIRRHLPDARVCVILRDPAERAYSAFMHAKREGREPLPDLGAGLEAEPWRIRENWGFLWRYADMGRCCRQLGRYYDAFPAEQIMVVLYDDLAHDPAGLCRKLEEFVGVDPPFVPDVSLRHNVSGVPRSRTGYRLLRSDSAVGTAARRLAPVVGRQRLTDWQVRLRNRVLRREPMPRATRERVMASIGEDVEKLEALIGRDLGRWRAAKDDTTRPAG